MLHVLGQQQFTPCIYCGCYNDSVKNLKLVFFCKLERFLINVHSGIDQMARFKDFE